MIHWNQFGDILISECAMNCGLPRPSLTVEGHFRLGLCPWVRGMGAIHTELPRLPSEAPFSSTFHTRSCIRPLPTEYCSFVYRLES